MHDRPSQAGSCITWTINRIMAGTILFYIFAFLAAVSAVGVAMSRNIVRAAVCLFFALVSVAGLYFLLHAEFLAAVQLVVYAGGTLVLIIFGVMLTSNAPAVSYQPRPIEVLAALLVGGLMLSSLAFAIVHWASLQGLPTRPVAGAPESPAGGLESDYIGNLGAALLGDYLLPFELVSVLLLVVMIGAAYLAKARRPERGAGSDGEMEGRP